MHALRLCADRQEPPPKELADAAEHVLVKPSRWDRLTLNEKQKEAVSYIAEHPAASNREVAKEIGTSHQNIMNWKKQRKFRLELNDQQKLREAEQFLSLSVERTRLLKRARRKRA